MFYLLPVELGSQDAKLSSHMDGRMQLSRFGETLQTHLMLTHCPTGPKESTFWSFCWKLSYTAQAQWHLNLRHQQDGMLMLKSLGWKPLQIIWRLFLLSHPSINCYVLQLHRFKNIPDQIEVRNTRRGRRQATETTIGNWLIYSPLIPWTNII